MEKLEEIKSSEKRNSEAEAICDDADYLFNYPALRMGGDTVYSELPYQEENKE